MAENRAEYWIRYRATVPRGELAQALLLLRPTDPELFLPKSAPAPLLFQCARFDMDDVRRDCETAYQAAAEPKVLRWYDVEHHFADFEVW